MYFIFVLTRKWPYGLKILSGAPLIILLALWLFSYDADTTWTDKRVSAFPIGGQLRVAWAGGANRVREDGLKLLDYSQDATLPRAELPISIRRLGATSVQVHKNEGIVKVFTLRRLSLDDEFGFFIQDVSAQAPESVDETGGHRIWKLAEGIYLYENW